MRGSLVHDALYQLIREGELGPGQRRMADGLLHEICLADGMSYLRIGWVYLAVRVFGRRFAKHRAPAPRVNAMAKTKATSLRIIRTVGKYIVLLQKFASSIAPWLTILAVLWIVPDLVKSVPYVARGLSVVGSITKSFPYANLSDLNLSGLDLREFDFRHAILTGVDLRNARLNGAYLYDTILYNANLKDAKLAGANLTGAILDLANLSGAELELSGISQQQLDSTCRLSEPASLDSDLRGRNPGIFFAKNYLATAIENCALSPCSSRTYVLTSRSSDCMAWGGSATSDKGRFCRLQRRVALPPPA